MITERQSTEFWGLSGTQYDAPERKPCGNSGAEDANNAPKVELRIGNSNVRTLYVQGKAAQGYLQNLL